MRADANKPVYDSAPDARGDARHAMTYPNGRAADSTTKEAVYLLMLREAGQFTDLEIRSDAVPMLQRVYRYTEVLGEEEGRAMVRCYLGSSGYNTEEMARLIDHTVDEAQALGIETMTPDELEHMKQTWKGEGYGY